MTFPTHLQARPVSHCSFVLSEFGVYFSPRYTVWLELLVYLSFSPVCELLKLGHWKQD